MDPGSFYESSSFVTSHHSDPLTHLQVLPEKGNGVCVGGGGGPSASISKQITGIWYQ
jgi:hypothetical protein